ncbi:MAG: hypothetical protein HQK54_14150 [Oligoflexales bacterium]|nr:hypothetical protein [Oligoflexales bacterium]
MISFELNYFPDNLIRNNPDFSEILADLETKSTLSRGKIKDQIKRSLFFSTADNYQQVDDALSFKRNLGIFHDLVVVVGSSEFNTTLKAVTDTLNHKYTGLVSSCHSGAKPIIAYLEGQVSEPEMVEFLDLLEEKEPLINFVCGNDSLCEIAANYRIIKSHLQKKYTRQEVDQRIIFTARLNEEKQTGSWLLDLRNNVCPANFDLSIRLDPLILTLILCGFSGYDFVDGFESLFSIFENDDHPDQKALSQYISTKFAFFSAGYDCELIFRCDQKLENFGNYLQKLSLSQAPLNGKFLQAHLPFSDALEVMACHGRGGNDSKIFGNFLNVDEIKNPDGGYIERRLRIPHIKGISDHHGYIEGRWLNEVKTAALKGTIHLFNEAKMPSVCIRLSRLDERGIASLVSFFEIAQNIFSRLSGYQGYQEKPQNRVVNISHFLGKSGRNIPSGLTVG